MPKVVDFEKQRKEILFKSFDLFAQKGYANVASGSSTPAASAACRNYLMLPQT
jgi:hypothetical protein